MDFTKSRRSFRCVAHSLLLGVSGVTLMQPAQAQTDLPAERAGVEGLEEIVVTARRREERLQDTPVAVTAFDAASMDARSIGDLGDIDNFAPNVTINSAPLSSGANFIASAFIRGIGQGDFLGTTDPGVGVYVDDVYLARAQGALLDLSDIQRIEVLRGPQGTLFGKNAIGGVIQAVSKQPGPDLAGYLEASYGRFNRIRVRGDVNVPLSDTLFLAGAFSIKDSDGFGKRLDLLTGQKVASQGSEGRQGGRLRARWEPTDSFDATLSFDYARVREQAAANDIVAVDDSNGLISFYNALVADPVPYTAAAILTADPYTTYSGSADRDDNRADMDNWGLSLVMNWRLGAASLKSVTAYRDLKVIFGRDGDGGPQKMVDNLGRLDQTQFSQEFQLSGQAFDDRLQWLVGAYYLKEKVRDVTDVVVASGIFAALEALPGAIIPLGPVTCPNPLCAGGAGNPLNIGFDNDYLGINELRTESYSAFASATYKITDQFSLTLGARITHENKGQVIPFYRRNVSNVDTVPPGTSFSKKYNAFTPKLGLEYKPSRDVLLYASASRGFRSGGFNGRPTLVGSLGPFGQEYLWSYEVGAKSEWAHGRLRANVAAFRMDYSDIQTVVLVASGVTIAPRTDNAGDARISGAELELEAVPFKNGLINASLGYIDAHYTSLGPATEIGIDNKFAQTPKWTLSVGAQVKLPIANIGSLTPRIDYAYRSSHFNDNQNSPNLFQKGYGLLNARLTLRTEDSGWSFELYGTNLTGKAYITGGLAAITSLGFDEAVRGRPREYGVSISKRF